ncbi:MAG: hypothetical protein GY835_03140 [bacterium]|nr:hypothetical protein [bacterium]
MAIVESFLTVLGATSAAASLHSWFSGIKAGGTIEEAIRQLEILHAKVERISDHILYAPDVEQVQSFDSQASKLTDPRELREVLEPMQSNLGTDLLATGVISTPEKLKAAFRKDPWEVLIEARPASRMKKPTNPDLVPILFLDQGTLYVGWQTRGVLPILLDCDYEASLLVGHTTLTASEDPPALPGNQGSRSPAPQQATVPTVPPTSTFPSGAPSADCMIIPAQKSFFFTAHTNCELALDSKFLRFVDKDNNRYSFEEQIDTIAEVEINTRKCLMWIRTNTGTLREVEATGKDLKLMAKWLNERGVNVNV